MSAACEPTASRPSRSQTFPAAAQAAVQLSPVASARRHSRSAGSIGGGDSGGAEGGGGGGGGSHMPQTLQLWTVPCAGVYASSFQYPAPCGGNVSIGAPTGT